MKKIIFILLLILMITFGLYGEHLKKEFNVEPGKTLDIDLKSGGSITISGWEKKQVSVTVRFKNGNSGDWDISFDQTANGIEIESRFKGEESRHHGSSAFDIRVPREFDLKLKTMGGNISIDNVEGKITGKTMGGKLDLNHLKGFIALNTMGGKIILKDSDIDGKVKTMGGRVLLENVVGDISGSSMGGNVVYKNVKTRSGKSSGEVLRITTMGGAINVSDAGHGAKLKTMGGDIHVKSAKEFVKATTMGGDITVDSIDGWISATTMGGDIEVTMTGDPGKGKRDVKLKSMAGDITLLVPAGLSMDIDIELCHSKKNRKNYKIVSDFDIKQEEKPWDKNDGSDGKCISGKGIINGGKHKIKIRTVSGNVYLKKR